MELLPILPENFLSERPVVIAGPCSAETEEQVLNTAGLLASQGIHIFRAGIWKPRTKPGGFEGVGEKGLPWLQEVKKETGMITAVEVANAKHVELAVKYGVDMLWVGARTSVNPFAMQELADAMQGIELPILVKNPVNPDIELWMGAIERLYKAGVRKIGAIHRGFSTYESKLYRNMPQWSIPIELKRRLPNLPIFCDPSHMGGKRELVASISQQALDMNFDGLMIESHCNPQQALSDKDQQVTPDVLSYILKHLIVRETGNKSSNLSKLREKIDDLDEELMEILSKRMEVCREIGRYKKENNLTVLQSGRYDAILQKRASQGMGMKMGGDFIKKIFESIHEESVKQQLEIVGK